MLHLPVHQPLGSRQIRGGIKWVNLVSVKMIMVLTTLNCTLSAILKFKADSHRPKMTNVLLANPCYAVMNN